MTPREQFEAELCILLEFRGKIENRIFEEEYWGLYTTAFEKFKEKYAPKENDDSTN